MRSDGIIRIHKRGIGRFDPMAAEIRRARAENTFPWRGAMLTHRSLLPPPPPQQQQRQNLKVQDSTSTSECPHPMGIPVRRVRQPTIEGINYRPHLYGPPHLYGFLERDINEPDTVSLRLLRSGDVEQNPGPLSPKRNGSKRQTKTARDDSQNQSDQVTNDRADAAV